MDKTLINKRFNKTKRMAQLLQIVPFIRAVILNGSLAQGRSSQKSDIDLLIIVKSGRLFTARLFTIALSFLTGQKRSKNENRSHAGKFCLNYFLADDYLKIPVGRGEEMDRYCADNYSKSVLVWGDERLYEKFFAINKELFDKARPAVIPGLTRNLDSCWSLSRTMMRGRNDKKADKNHFLSMLQHLFERPMNGTIGDWFEQKMKNFQIRMIEKDPRTKEYPDLIVYNDREARFHPPRRER